MQRIGVTLREKKEFDKASDILERVLVARKKQYLKDKRLTDKDDVEFSGKDFAKLYGDLALTYQGMEDLEDSQEYLVLAIQTLEKLQLNNKEDPDTLHELADSYLFLADLLRK